MIPVELRGEKKRKDSKKMKKQLMVLGGALAAALLTGCVSTHTNDGTATVKISVTKDYKADVVAQEKAVTGEATVHNVLGLITWGVSEFADDAFVTTNGAPILQLGVNPIGAAKQGATYKACAASKADAILAAKYNMNITDYFVYKQIKCKVTGYPASIKGVK